MTMRVMLIGSDAAGAATLAKLNELDGVSVVAVASPPGPYRCRLGLAASALGLPVHPWQSLTGPVAAAIAGEHVLDLIVVEDALGDLPDDAVAVAEQGALIACRGLTAGEPALPTVVAIYEQPDGHAESIWQRVSYRDDAGNLDHALDLLVPETLAHAVAAIRDRQSPLRERFRPRRTWKRAARPAAPGRNQTAKT